MRRPKVARTSLICLTIPVMFGCSQDADGEGDAELGSVRLPLITSTASAIYRLADATFTVDGPTSTSLSASDDPAEFELVAALEPGNYEVLLEPGWALERDSGSGFSEVEATLVDGNPRLFTIQPDTITALTYRFETDGTIVGTGEGQFAIDIQVDDSAAATCTPFGSDCPAGNWCAGAFDGGCVPVGPQAPGDDCSQTADCAANSLCNPDPLGDGYCREYCPPEQVGSPCPASGLICKGVGVPGYGVCF
jgi:hypothetical protein